MSERFTKKDFDDLIRLRMARTVFDRRHPHQNSRNSDSAQVELKNCLEIPDYIEEKLVLHQLGHLVVHCK